MVDEERADNLKDQGGGDWYRETRNPIGDCGNCGGRDGQEVFLHNQPSSASAYGAFAFVWSVRCVRCERHSETHVTQNGAVLDWNAAQRQAETPAASESPGQEAHNNLKDLGYDVRKDNLKNQASTSFRAAESLERDYREARAKAKPEAHNNEAQAEAEAAAERVARVVEYNQSVVDYNQNVDQAEAFEHGRYRAMLEICKNSLTEGEINRRWQEGEAFGRGLLRAVEHGMLNSAALRECILGVWGNGEKGGR